MKVLFIPDLSVSDCVKMIVEETGPFAVIGNKGHIPLFIGVPCGIDVEEEPLRATREAIGKLEKLAGELEAPG